jgi:hypothetical protein
LYCVIAALTSPRPSARKSAKHCHLCELISLRHAMKNYLGSDSGPAAVLLAVIEGRLEPVGFTDRFRGITGYLFRSKDLRKYRPIPERKSRPEVFLNFREAAEVLRVRSYVVRIRQTNHIFPGGRSI